MLARLIPVLLFVPALAAAPSAALAGDQCSDDAWRAPGKRTPAPLGKAKIVRSNDMILDFELGQVAPQPDVRSRGGITGVDNLARNLPGCGDDPRGGGGARPGASLIDPGTGLVIEIVRSEPAGKSGRGWEGHRCTYRIRDREDSSRAVEIEAPAFNEITGLVREGDAVFVALQFNGYAREIKRRGNLVAALDLCNRRVVWRSQNLVSNAGILLHGDFVVTAYGFTAEPDAIFVLHRANGRVAQRVRIPKAASELVIQDGALYARIYDGYARVPLRR